MEGGSPKDEDKQKAWNIIELDNLKIYLPANKSYENDIPKFDRTKVRDEYRVCVSNEL